MHGSADHSCWNCNNSGRDGYGYADEISLLYHAEFRENEWLQTATHRRSTAKFDTLKEQMYAVRTE